MPDLASDEEDSVGAHRLGGVPCWPSAPILAGLRKAAVEHG